MVRVRLQTEEDGKTDGQTLQTDRQAERPMDGWRDKQTEEWMDGQVSQVDGDGWRADGWTGRGRTDRQDRNYSPFP